MKNVIRGLAKIMATAFLVLVMLASLLFTQRGQKAFAQAAGYRYTTNGLVLIGQTGMLCWEPYRNAGPDNCLIRLGTSNQLGLNINGNPSSEYGLLSAPPAVATSTATSGGSIANGTYRAAATVITALGGETLISSDSGSTQTTTGSGLSTITITAPIAQAGAIGWEPYLSAAGGAANSELSQPVINASGGANCTGAFQIFPTVPSAYQAAQSDRPARWVCPFGANWTLTTQPLTTPTVVYSTTAQIGGQPNTTVTVNDTYGYAVPLVNSAGYPEALPSVACNFVPQTALTSVTTAQTAATCPLWVGMQNYFGKEIEVSGEGIYTSSAASGAPVVAVTEGGITPITVTGTTQTGTTANSQFAFDYVITTSLTGTVGTVEAHGWLQTGPGASLTAAVNVMRDSNSAASSTFNLTAQNNLAIAISDATSLTSAQLRHARVNVLN